MKLTASERAGLVALDQTYTSLHGTPDQAPDDARRRWLAAREQLADDTAARREREDRRREKRAIAGRDWYT